MVANILPADPPPTPDPEGGVKSKQFSVHVHVAYQIEVNNECRNMVANILLIDLPPHLITTLQVRLKGQNSTFLHMARHIKLNGTRTEVDGTT